MEHYNLTFNDLYNKITVIHGNNTENTVNHLTSILSIENIFKFDKDNESYLHELINKQKLRSEIYKKHELINYVLLIDNSIDIEKLFNIYKKCKFTIIISLINTSYIIKDEILNNADNLICTNPYYSAHLYNYCSLYKFHDSELWNKSLEERIIFISNNNVYYIPLVNNFSTNALIKDEMKFNDDNLINKNTIILGQNKEMCKNLGDKIFKIIKHNKLLHEFHILTIDDYETLKVIVDNQKKYRSDIALMIIIDDNISEEYKIIINKILKSNITMILISNYIINIPIMYKLYYHNLICLDGINLQESIDMWKPDNFDEIKQYANDIFGKYANKKALCLCKHKRINENISIKYIEL